MKKTILIKQEDSQELEKAKHDFLEGKLIGVEHFLFLLKEQEIKISLRNLRSIRNRIRYISITQYLQKNKRASSYSIFDIAKELKEKLQA